MSVDNCIFMRRSSMLTPTDWQRAIDASGLSLKLDTDFEIGAFEGFLPCVLDDEPAGFEIFFEEIDLDNLVNNEVLTSEQRNVLADRSFLVTLSTRSNFREGLSSVFAAAVLCSGTDGMLTCEGEPFVAASAAIEWARSIEPGMRQGIAEQLARQARRNQRPR